MSLVMPPQRTDAVVRPQTRSQTADSRRAAVQRPVVSAVPRRSARKKWVDFKPTTEEVERHQRTLDLDVELDTVSDLSDAE